MRILMLTQWFNPEPTLKGLEFARELVHQGFDVEVITGFPNYPSGKLYPGYRLRWLQREVIDGVHVTRVPLYPNHDQSAIKRVLNYASFGTTSLIYGLFGARRADVLYAYHPPLTVGVAASFIRLFRRIPVVYDIQDMWPDTLRATGMLTNARVLKVVAAVCGWVYRRVDHIVVLSPGFKRLLLERGVPASKLEVIYNWADDVALASTATDELPETFPSPPKFRILFAGNIGKAQHLQTVLEAASLLQARGSRVCFVMLGGGVELEQLKNEAARQHLENVEFLPAVPMAQVGGYLRAADALLVHLRRDPLFEITIPSKTQAYMAVGKPLLMAVTGDAADLVHKSGGGLVVEPENAEALAEAAEHAAAMTKSELIEMGQSAETYYTQHLSLSVGVRSFAEIFRQLALGEK